MNLLKIALVMLTLLSALLISGCASKPAVPRGIAGSPPVPASASIGA